MGIVYWQDASETACVAKNMQGIALDPGLWTAYASCGQKGRAVFQRCATDDHEWLLDTVLAYAAYEENPTPMVTALAPKPVAISTVFLRPRGQEENTNDLKFIAWMLEHTAATNKDKSLSYEYGERRVLGDGTIAVSVGIRRSKGFLRGAGFVFHYHRGAKGASVGSAEGSKWHFKPFDGAKTWVRLPDYKFSALNITMVKTVKEIVKSKR